VYHCHNCDVDHTITSLDTHAPMDPAYDQGSLSASLKETLPVTSTQPNLPTGPVFPYVLDDLLYWVIKRKSGELVRFNLTPHTELPGSPGRASGWGGSIASGSATPKLISSGGSLSQWCHHDPAAKPLFAASRLMNKKVQIHDAFDLFIADAEGVRKHKESFDFVIDCGDVISDMYATRSKSILTGPEWMVDALDSYTTAAFTGPQVIKINWDDRKAPNVKPEFWLALASVLKGKVVTNCQGGHGRSGTTAVCLMMVCNPEYGAADAITHLRAIHCPRAIESIEQHQYIDTVAKFLKRKADSESVQDITNFKEAFLKLDRPSAKPYQERLKG